MTNATVAPRYVGVRSVEEKAAQAKMWEEEERVRRQREDAFNKLGGLAGYLDAVERLCCEGELSLADAKIEQAWAHDHAKQLERKAQQAGARKAQQARECTAREEAARREAERWAEIDAAWLASAASAPIETGPGSVFDYHGEPIATVSSLTEFAAAAKCVVRRHAADERTRLCRWWVDTTGETLPPHGSPSFVPEPRHWVLAIDTEGVVPPGLRGARLREWCIAWREGVRGLRGAELAVYAVPGQHPAFLTWWADPLTDAEARSWLRRLEPPSEDSDPRFNFKDEWHVPDAPIVLHAGAAALPKASTIAATPAGRLVTGIGELDRLFRGKPGIPMGACAVITGSPKNGKTLLASVFAQAAVDSGFFVGWLAVDEPPEGITTRRLQRLGLSPEAALEPPAAALATLDAQAFRVTAEGELEDLWEKSHAEAEGRPLLIVGDSLQTIRAAAAEGKGEREGLEALIGVVKECQRKWPAIFLTTSEITRDGTPKGSSRILYSFTTCLAVRRAGDRLTITAAGGREHRDGKVELLADFDGQQLLDPEAAALAAADAELWSRMGAVLTEIGKASQRELERRLGGKAEAVRECVHRHLKTGDLRRIGSKLEVA